MGLKLVVFVLVCTILGINSHAKAFGNEQVKRDLDRGNEVRSFDSLIEEGHGAEVPATPVKNVESAEVPRGHNTRFKVHRIYHHPHKTQEEKVSQVEALAEPLLLNQVKSNNVKIVEKDDSQVVNSKKNDNDVIIAESPDQTSQNDKIQSESKPKSKVSEKEDAKPNRVEDNNWHDVDRNDVMNAAAMKEPFQNYLLPPQQKEDEQSKDNNILPQDPQALRHDYAGSKTHPVHQAATMADVYFLAVVAACSVAGLVGVIVAGVCWYRLQKNVKAASEAEYPQYGVTGPTNKDRVTSPGDRKLAHSAQMYHYQHQKQQMIALEKAHGEMKQDASEEDSEEENEEGDYTVYECPGLAPTGEMEVKNPLFSDETPVTPTPTGDKRLEK